MKIFLSVLMAVFTSLVGFAQSDTTTLMKQARARLEGTGANVSTLLTDQSYISLHPLTSFRELIKKHAYANLLSITPANEPGKKIKVMATITSKDGQPLANALVYLYQTDSRGWYAAESPHVLQNEGDFRHARLFGYVKTDKDGRLELHTVKPSGYPESDLPAHIHVHVWADGYRNHVTEFLFKDDERLKGEILNQAVVHGGLIAVPEKSTAPFEQQFRYNIKLTKE